MTAAERVARGAAPKLSKAQLHALRGVAAGLIRNGIGGGVNGEFAGQRVRGDVLDRLYAANLIRSVRDGMGTIAPTDLGRQVIDREGDGCEAYRVDFDHVGDDRDVPALDLRAANLRDIDQIVERHARRLLGDWDVYVLLRPVDAKSTAVRIVSRGSDVGTGTATRLAKPAAPPTP